MSVTLWPKPKNNWIQSVKLYRTYSAQRFFIFSYFSFFIFWILRYRLSWLNCLPAFDSDVSPWPWPGLKACRWRPWPWPLRSRPWPWTVRPWPLWPWQFLGLPWSWPYEALTVNYQEQTLVFLACNTDKWTNCFCDWLNVNMIPWLNLVHWYT